MATVHPHPSAWSKDKPVYSSHRLLKYSTNPSARHLHAMTGMERYISQVLGEHGGNVSHAALTLRVSRVALQKKMKKYGLR
jgi:transcriptional regulator with PAS, ATPase and Fis domain